MDIRFELGNSLIICGPSKAGKTHWVLNLIRHRHLLFKGSPPSEIYWFYGTWQDSNRQMKENGIILIDGISDEDIAKIKPNSLVVIDDLVMETESSRAVTSLFTKHVHHKNLFLIYITQNFYHQSKEARMRHLNSHYIVFF